MIEKVNKTFHLIVIVVVITICCFLILHSFRNNNLTHNKGISSQYDVEYNLFPEGFEVKKATSCNNRTFVYGCCNNLPLIYEINSLSISEVHFAHNNEDEIVTLSSSETGNIQVVILRDSDEEADHYVFSEYDKYLSETISIPFDLSERKEVLFCTFLNNSLIVLSDNRFTSYDTKGNQLSELVCTEKLFSVAKTSSGKVFISQQKGDSTGILELKCSNGILRWGTPIVCNYPCYYIYNGFDTEKLLYSDGNNLYSVNVKTGETEHLLNLSVYCLSTKLIHAIDDKTLLGISNGRPILLKSTENNMFSVIRLHSYQVNSMLYSAIIDFNLSSSSYKVELTDYYMYDILGATEGFQQFQNQLQSSDSPDIIDLTNLNLQYYINHNTISPVTDNYYPDFQYNKDTVTKCLWDSMYSRDNIYCFCPAFRIITMVCSKKTFSLDRISPSNLMDYVIQNQSSSPILFSDQINRESFLRYIIGFSGNDLIDWENNTCDFTSSYFIEMIQIAKQIPMTIEKDIASQELGLLAIDEQLFSVFQTRSIVEDLIIYNTIFNNQENYIGFPSKTGHGSAVIPCVQLGLHSNSHNIDGAISFFSFFFEKEYQEKISRAYQCIPANNGALTSIISDDLNYYSSNPVRLSTFAHNKEIILTSSVSINDIYDQLCSLVNSPDRVWHEDSIINAIILKESTALFEGKASIEKTVSAIQTQVEYYLSDMSK